MEDSKEKQQQLSNSETDLRNSEEEEDDSENEINDARLLESMLRDSETYDPPGQTNMNNQAEGEDERNCWVCFASDEDDPTAIWTHPCKCRGTTKWVHQACIQRWVDEKQKGNTLAGVECPQCGYSYIIRLPNAGVLVACLDSGDKLVQKLCPIIAGGVCVGSLYWTCVTFGAVTFMQAVGHDRGMILMERVDPLFLLVSLPLVPVGLVIGKMVRWEEPVLKCLRGIIPKVPLVRNVLPSFAYEPERHVLQSTLPPMSDPISVTRTFCGALFFPTIAAFLGATLYDHVPSQLKRTLLGGATFILVKGILKVYHKQHTYIRQCQRQILDYTAT